MQASMSARPAGRRLPGARRGARKPLAAGFVALGLLVVGTASAAPPTAQAATPARAPTTAAPAGTASALGTAAVSAPVTAGVEGWLSAVRAAAAQYSFSGHYVVTGDGVASSSRIVHYGQGRDSYERIETLDGTPRIVLRHNDTVHTVWPRERVTVVEQRSPMGGFPSPAAPPGTRLDDHYRVASVTQGRVAGRDADVVSVQARDELRYSHRLWVDSTTRLLLRSDVLGPRDEVLASASFTDLSVGVKPQPARVLAAMKAKNDNWQTLPSALQPTTLQAEGWRIDPLPAGYRLLSSVRRALQPGPASPAERPSVLQAVFSDGLASVSVFIEDASDPAAPSGMLQTGSTTTVMQHRDRFRVTVVGDLPARTARHFADAVQRKSP